MSAFSVPKAMRAVFLLASVGAAVLSVSHLLLAGSGTSNPGREAPAHLRREVADVAVDGVGESNRELARHWYKKTHNPNGDKVWRRAKWSWYNNKKKGGHAYQYYADRPGWAPHPNKKTRGRKAAVAQTGGVIAEADAPTAPTTTTTTTTPEPFPASARAFDAAECPEGYEPITSAEECEALGTLEGNRWGGSRSYVDIPANCWALFGNKYYFNTGAGDPNEEAQVVCKPAQ